jgi:tetratricopeptide (TPR) repeat protein
MLDQLVQRYPENEAALQALQDQARIYTSNIGNYYSAIKTYQRIADMFPGEAAVAGLVRAAELARKKIEDFELQVVLQNRLVVAYPGREESIVALYSSAETLEENLHDPAQAIIAYQTLVGAHPDHKLASSAEKRRQELNTKQ